MPLITCPECNHQISSKSVNCPHCGFPLAEFIEKEFEDETEAVEALAGIQKEKRKSSHKEADNIRIGNFGKAFLVILVVFIFSAILGSNDSKKRSRSKKNDASNSSIAYRLLNGNSDTDNYSIAYKLAALNVPGHVSEDDPIVTKFQVLLDEITNHSKLSEEQVGNRLYKSYSLLKNKGCLGNLTLFDLSVTAAKSFVADNLKKYYSFDDTLSALMIFICAENKQ